MCILEQGEHYYKIRIKNVGIILKEVLLLI